MLNIEIACDEKMSFENDKWRALCQCHFVKDDIDVMPAFLCFLKVIFEK